MLVSILITLLAFGLAAATYLRLERLGRRAWLPLICRGVAWTALGLLLLNLSCTVRGTPLRPLVLLDASLSMGAAGGHWREARDSAARWGEVRPFGDERLTTDTLPSRGRSLLAPALVAASASDRSVIVVSDGEVEDQAEIPADILSRATIRVFPRDVRPDLAISAVSGPARVSAGDSIALELLVQSVGAHNQDSARIEVFSGADRLASRTIRIRGDATRARMVLTSARLPAGDHLLRVRLARSGDAEPRTDLRHHLVTVAPTPGVVLLASPPDWDSRFLYQTLREVAQLPVRGYLRLDANRWYSMSDLRPISADRVRRAARGADLLVLKGNVADIAGTEARGVWSWPSGETGQVVTAGDWYLSAADASPLASAFLGQPVDSFPPATHLTPLETRPQDWVGVYAQLGRRGPRRAAILGRQEGRERRVIVAVDGLWRWAFRGGSSEQSYRSWVAATTSWLLAGRDSARGVARPVRPVVANGRPVVFEWIGAGTPTPQVVRWSTSSVERVDTLYFDGDGRATAWLPPGEYRYRLQSGGQGLAAVEQYSEELLPRALTLRAQSGSAASSSSRTTTREWLWLFGLCVVGLSGEWLARRRLGLR